METNKEQNEIRGIISDTSPVIGLSKINKLIIIKEVYGNLFIPEAVETEILKGINKPGYREIQEYEWIKKVKVKNINKVKEINNYVGIGESEAIVLSGEMNLPLLCDDRRARKIAKDFGYRNIFGIYVLIAEAKLSGIISSVEDIVDALCSVNYWIDKDALKKIIMKVREISDEI